MLSMHTKFVIAFRSSRCRGTYFNKQYEIRLRAEYFQNDQKLQN